VSLRLKKHTLLYPDSRKKDQLLSLGIQLDKATYQPGSVAYEEFLQSAGLGASKVRTIATPYILCNPCFSARIEAIILRAFGGAECSSTCPNNFRKVTMMHLTELTWGFH
jgi:hypothetical protein